MSTNMEIAKTIGQQMGGFNRLGLFVGANNFMADNNALSFRFKAKAKNRANYIKISLNAADLYDVEFGRIHGDSYKVVSTESNLYCNQLIEQFERETGLYLRF